MLDDNILDSHHIYIYKIYYIIYIIIIYMIKIMYISI